MKKIAVLFPVFMGGGAEAVCLWICEALKNDYEISLITLTWLDFDNLNRLYRTKLSSDKIKLICPLAKNLSGLLVKLSDNNLVSYSLRQHILMWYFKKQAAKFDLAISAYNEMDLGTRGIQYIHYPQFTQGGRFLRWLSGYQEARMKNNISLTNSGACRDYILRVSGIESKVVYPAVVDDFKKAPWSEREDGFVISGRFTADKNIHGAIKLIDAVRCKGFRVHLHITGIEGNRGYENFLRSLQKKNSAWVFIEKGLSRDAYCRVLQEHKYGLHMKREPFGIAPAEMLKAGCIVFVPGDTGGQKEIVGEHTALTFKNMDDAAQKIIAVLSSKEEQSLLLDFLSGRRGLFSTDLFMAQIRENVASML